MQQHSIEVSLYTWTFLLNSLNTNMFLSKLQWGNYLSGLSWQTLCFVLTSLNASICKKNLLCPIYRQLNIYIYFKMHFQVFTKEAKHLTLRNINFKVIKLPAQMYTLETMVPSLNRVWWTGVLWDIRIHCLLSVRSCNCLQCHSRVLLTSD